MPSVFESVRKASSPQVWSRGIELVRANAVAGERRDGDEVVVRVATKGGMIARNVTLFLDDGQWECTCGAAVCEHAAAAAIAWKRAADEGHDLETAKDRMGTVAYRFTRETGGLGLERGIVVAGTFHPFEATLAALSSGRVPAPAFTARQEDLAAELALGTHRRGAIPRASVAKVLRALQGSAAVTLDDEPATTAATPVGPRIVVEDQGEGFRVALTDDPEVDEIFANGIARCGRTLRPAVEAKLTGREMHELGGGRHFGPSSWNELVTELLPSLRGRIPIDLKTERLPGTERIAPRIAIDVRRDGATLHVLATLVYGDPPQARVDGGRLVHLQGPVPLRDEGAEAREVRRLGGRLGLTPGIPSDFTGAAAVAFTAKLSHWPGEVRGAGREHFTLAPPLVPRVTIRDDGGVDVLFAGDAPAGGRRGTASAASVLAAFRAGESLVALDAGGYAPLPVDWLSRFGPRIADLLAARDESGTVPRALLGDVARLAADLDQPVPAALRGLEALVSGFEELPEPSLPADLAATLRPYQKRGVSWLTFLRRAELGALLADDMGLGKTLQALCATYGRTLVVAPTSVVHNWSDEIARFRPGLVARVYHGAKRELDDAADVTITSYALLRRDEQDLAQKPWDTLILDEAQAIKNPESQVAQAAFRLPARWRVTLSGTPVENRLDELWSQMHFLNRGLLGGRRDFQERYARPIETAVEGSAARLRERIRPFVLRRLKEDVAPELPPRTDAILYCALAPEEREVYDAVRAATKNEVVAKLREGGSVLAALEALLRLRQAACHTALVPGQTAHSSAKVERLRESLETVVAERHKALVFSQWTGLLDLIEPHLRAASVAFTRLDGSTADRAGVVARFQAEDGPPVMLISLKAGGTGLNLTAADHVFLMDPWWNPAVEDQAADRAHRIGQDRPVLVYRLVAEDTVEERMLALQESKRAVADAALGEAAAAASLTRDDLLALLE
ncbi:MAG TPA: DEAD/DEAH box helicase [Candidatus Polarisedimenticolaceae bacterium]|nr:DEAD/DEAH box helicase [Candidatus Polarisedimenticolaceae bacterium]